MSVRKTKRKLESIVKSNKKSALLQCCAFYMQLNLD